MPSLPSSLTLNNASRFHPAAVNTCSSSSQCCDWKVSINPITERMEWRLLYNTRVVNKIGKTQHRLSGRQYLDSDSHPSTIETHLIHSDRNAWTKLSVISESFQILMITFNFFLVTYIHLYICVPEVPVYSETSFLTTKYIFYILTKSRNVFQNEYVSPGLWALYFPLELLLQLVMYITGHFSHSLLNQPLLSPLKYSEQSRQWIVAI